MIFHSYLAFCIVYLCIGVSDRENPKSGIGIVTDLARYPIA